MSATCLNYANRNLSQIPNISPNARVLKLNISRNPITDFRGMNTYRSLGSLMADDTKLLSFKGLVPQNDISQISARRTPLGTSQYFPLMSLIAFGDQLVVVNNQTITDGQRERANKLRPFVYGYLADGWVLLNLCPIVLMDPVTRRRKRVYSTVNQDQLAACDEVVFVREQEPSPKKPEESEESAEKEVDEDDETKALRARFRRFQRNLEDNIEKKSGSPVRCVSRQADTNTLRNSMRRPLSPQGRPVSPGRDRPFETK